MRTLILTTALLVTACGGATASPSASPTATPTPAPTTVPTAVPSEDPIAHIEAAAAELLTYSTNAGISAWIDAESTWTETQVVTPVVRQYIIVIARALIEVIYADEDTDLRVYALELYESVGEIPGVSLP